MNLKKTITLIIVSGMFLLSGKVVVRAKETSGVVVSPFVKELKLDSGEQEQFSIKLQNNEDFDLNIQADIVNARPDINNYGIKKEDKDVKLPSDWIVFPVEKKSLRSGETANYQVDINVPITAEPKSYYAIIELDFSAVSGLQELTSSGKVGVSIYLTVNGGKKDNDLLTNIKSRINLNEKSLFKPSFKADLNIRNDSQFHFQPRGVVTIYDPNGVRQSEVFRLNNELNYLLPGQSISDSIVWKDQDFKLFPPIGRYNLIFNTYVDDSQEELLIDKKSFFVLPYQYFLYLGGIFILGGIVFGLQKFINYKKFKKYQV